MCVCNKKKTYLLKLNFYFLELFEFDFIFCSLHFQSFEFFFQILNLGFQSLHLLLMSKISHLFRDWRWHLTDISCSRLYKEKDWFCQLLTILQNWTKCLQLNTNHDILYLWQRLPLLGRNSWNFTCRHFKFAGCSCNIGSGAWLLTGADWSDRSRTTSTFQAFCACVRYDCVIRWALFNTNSSGSAVYLVIRCPFYPNKVTSFRFFHFDGSLKNTRST